MFCRETISGYVQKVEGKNKAYPADGPRCIDANGVGVLHDDVTAGRVVRPVVVLAVQDEKNGLVAIEGVDEAVHVRRRGEGVG